LAELTWSFEKNGKWPKINRCK